MYFNEICHFAVARLFAFTAFLSNSYGFISSSSKCEENFNLLLFFLIFFPYYFLWLVREMRARKFEAKFNLFQGLLFQVDAELFIDFLKR